MPSAPARVAVVGAARTPIGKFGGSLRRVPAVALGVLASQEALRRSSLEPKDVEQVYFGHCIQAGTGQNPARQVLLGLGGPVTDGAATINMVCGSGMQATIFGMQAIRAGELDLVLVGGMESMSSAPFLVPAAARWGLKAGGSALDDAMLRDALLDAYGEHEHMGMTGERIAASLQLSRTDVDRFALHSHLAAAAATRDGVFRDEIVPVPRAVTGEAMDVHVDEGPRADSTLEGLGKLRPSFAKNGVLTPGNSSQLSDGAAALVLASERAVRERNLQPIGYLDSSAVSGVSPDRVMEAPIPTVQKHLAARGLRADEFDRIEHNEAFASASIAVQRAFGWGEGVFNVHGGAVALGHPIGASGARIVVTLLYELRRAKKTRGLATLCMGGGNGLSLIVDRIGL